MSCGTFKVDEEVAVPVGADFAGAIDDDGGFPFLHDRRTLKDGAGGKPVKRLKVDDVVHGNPSGMVLVMDFESPDAITGMFESDDYAALVPVRDRGFSEMNILLTHEM